MKPILLIAMLLMAAITTSAQSAPPAQTNGSITGRVMLGDKPAPNVMVTLSPAATDALKSITAMFEARPVNRTATDSDGVYRFDHLNAGRYALNAYAPAYVLPPEPNPGFPPGRVINVAEGQAVENQNFALTRGGVITGRITDAQGRAAVGQTITLTPADNDKAATASNPLAGSPFGGNMYMTDDRGIYRLYGLAAGRYLVSTGGTGAASFPTTGTKRYLEQTFYPGVTDKTKAAIVEVKEGAEAAGIDIRLGLMSQTYKASGRILDAATGKPFSTAAITYGAAEAESKSLSPRSLGTIPNARGEFQLEAIVPGKYYAFAWFDDSSEYYSDTMPFEITSADVTDITIKTHRGQTVIGTVIIDGGADAEAQASLAQLRLEAVNLSNEIAAPHQMAAKIAPDNSFRLTGVQPGRLNFSINPFITPTKFAVLRVERGGMAQKDGVQIAAGETVTDVRVVLAVASGTLRGDIKTTGDGSLDDYTFEVRATRTGNEQPFSKSTSEVDGSGRFTIGELIPGDYTVTASASGSNLASAPQHITVTKDAEATVSLSIELPAKKSKAQ